MMQLTPLRGTVVYLGVVLDRKVTLCSDPRDSVEAGFEGFAGECHGGLTRPSCSRVMAIHPKRGTTIRNTRQLSILSEEELGEIAAAMDLPRLAPEWVGANVVLRGIPALSTLPPASRLVFEGGAVLTIDIENGPCRHPGDVIEALHPGRGTAFPKAAKGRRGLVGWVERPGTLALGETCALHIPVPRRYAHA